MNIEYHTWWSPSLSQDMQLKVYGHFGKPVLVFPAQAGRFYEFEDFQMIDAIHTSIDSGRIKIFTIDSLDNQAWANLQAHPAERGRRHEDFDRYITQEVVPFIRQSCANPEIKLLVTGVSMGAYHAANFFFRHPDIFDALIALSGMYHLRMFVGEYMDSLVYFNSPLAYLPNLEDEWYLDRYRSSQIIVCSGQGAWENAMIADTQELKSILETKRVPAWVDLWGHDVNHDWPWWRKMMPYYLEKIGL